MMRVLVLGAGRQGTACAYDLLTSSDATVTLGDFQRGKVPGFLEPFLGDRLTLTELDVRDNDAVMDGFRSQSAVVSAVPYYFNFDLARSAIESGCHFADLGGNTEIVRQQETLHDRAVEQGVSAVVDCGLAPGMVNILARAGIDGMDSVVDVKLFVGGLPQHPRPPLNYQTVYSLEGAIDYYTTPSWVIRDGNPEQVDPLTELEEVEFPGPLGKLEAFHTAGGLSTMPWELAGSIRSMEYKTLRYPGHASVMRAIRELGLFSTEPIEIGGVQVRPREMFVAVVDPKLRNPDGKDLVALKVVVTGVQDGAPKSVCYQLLDYHDPDTGISAMMRTTGFSLSITAQMQVGGETVGAGVYPAYQAMPAGPYIEALARRGILIEREDG